MAGAWEKGPQRKLNVMVGMLHTGIVPFQWAMGLRHLLVPERTQFGFCSGQPFDMGRNSLAQMVFENDAEWLFFLDTDVITPGDALVKLLQLNRPLCSGVYYRRNSPIGPAIWNENPNGQGIMQLIDYPRATPFECDLVGAGCMLVHRSIFEKISKPWFLWTLDKLPKGIGCSEDFYFLRQVRQMLGIRPVIHPGVQCEHVGWFSSSCHGVYPTGETPPAATKDRMAWMRDHAVGQILDVGAHDGQVFGKDNPNVFGVDLDAYPLKNFTQANATHLPFKSKSFDTVALGEILEHVPDPVWVLKEAKRVAKAKVIASIPNEHEWVKEHKPLYTLDMIMKERNVDKKLLVEEGTKGAVRITDETATPHLWHIRHYTEKDVREQMTAAFGDKFKLEMIRYGGWSFFCLEADAS